mgnify:CR=1 FL=1
MQKAPLDSPSLEMSNLSNKLTAAAVSQKISDFKDTEPAMDDGKAKVEAKRHSTLIPEHDHQKHKGVSGLKDKLKEKFTDRSSLNQEFKNDCTK